jgi:hypothetical protein
MTRVILIGHAARNGEALDFKIGPWANGIGRMIRRTGGGTLMETGAGIWPTVEKAQAIATETTARILGPDCNIAWTRASD